MAKNNDNIVTALKCIFVPMLRTKKTFPDSVRARFHLCFGILIETY